jgi:hypothetical protein
MSEKNKELFAAPANPAANNSSADEKSIIEIINETIDVPLPSKGLVYNPTHPLHNKEIATLVEMTPTEEHILYDKKRIREGTVIDDLVQACLRDRSVSVDRLLSGDRDALFFVLRAESFDPVYKFDVECPKCTTKQMVEFIILEQLKLKALDLKDVEQSEQFANRFKFVLPKTGFVVEYKYATVGDSKQIVKEKKDRHKANIDQKFDLIYELASIIISINGVTNKNDILQVLTKLPSRDSMALRKHITKTEPGVDTTYDFKCKERDCGHEEKSTLPLDASFFFPHLGK